MNLRSTLQGGASRFAHLAGIGRPARTRMSDEDQPQGRADDGDEDKPDASDDDDKAPEGRRSRRSRADGDNDKPDAEGDDDKPDASDDDDKGPEGRRSRAEGDDDDDKDAEEEDDDKEMRGNSAAALARRRERARCAAIMAHPKAAENPELACELAFETNLSRTAALAVLKTARSARAAPGASRAAQNPRLVPAGGEDAPASSAKKIQSSWGAAFEKVGVKPR